MFLKIIYAYLFAIYHSLVYKPKRVRLDICNLCQLNCVKCWMRENEEIIKKQNGGFGYVSFETFKNFVEKHPFIEEIELSISGEIFLNPDFDKIIEYAYKKNIKVSCWACNLNDISETTAENLVKYNFHDITVSIDGASQETYSIYRRGGNFDKVIQNIKMINKYKEKYNSEFPKLKYKFIIFGHNEHEIEKAKQIAKELNMEIVFDMNCFPEYSPVKNTEKIKEQTGLINFKNWSENQLLQAYRSNWCNCKDLFDFPVINFNGDLLGCCVHSRENLGVNVFKVGLLKALRHKNVIHSKAMLYELKVKPKKGIPCTNCHFYKYIKNKKRDLKRILKNFY